MLRGDDDLPLRLDRVPEDMLRSREPLMPNSLSLGCSKDCSWSLPIAASLVSIFIFSINGMFWSKPWMSRYPSLG